MPTRRSKQRPTSPLRSSQVNPASKKAVEALMVTNMGEMLASNLRASRSKVANPSSRGLLLKSIQDKIINISYSDYPKNKKFPALPLDPTGSSLPVYVLSLFTLWKEIVGWYGGALIYAIQHKQIPDNFTEERDKHLNRIDIDGRLTGGILIGELEKYFGCDLNDALKMYSGIAKSKKKHRKKSKKKKPKRRRTRTTKK